MPANFTEIEKYLKNQLNMSQEELAHELGVSFVIINHWENGKTNPSKIVCA